MNIISSQEYRRQRIILIVIILTGSLLVYFFFPLSLSFQVVCLHKKITGIGCPFCGLTHASYNVMHFRFRDAFVNNPAVFFLVAYFIAECVAFIQPALFYISLRKISTYILLASLLMVYILRLAHLLN